MNWVLILIIFNGGPQLYQIHFDSKDHCEKSRPIIERMVKGMGYAMDSKCIQVASDWDFDKRKGWAK